MSGQIKKRRTPVKVEGATAAVSVGGLVEAPCGKCKSVTRHIVLAKIGSSPTRVECKVCAAVHDYRSPTATPRTKREPAKAAAAAVSPEKAWADIMRRAKGEEIPYTTSARYAVGSRVRHASLGQGVVARLSSATVCEVVFSSGTVKLIMGRAVGDRPPE